MSIQISVVIWTVICFLLLMLILHNWLFKPVLEIMEKRRIRIEKAKEKQLEAQRLTVEHEMKLEEQKKAFENFLKSLFILSSHTLRMFLTWVKGDAPLWGAGAKPRNYLRRRRR